MNTVLDITEGLITVENGATTATISGATNDFFDQGTVLFAEGSGGLLMPVFVSQGSSENVLNLNRAWDKENLTDAPFSAFNTIEGLVSTLRIARSLMQNATEIGEELQEIVDSFSAFSLEQLLPQTDQAGWRDALGVLAAGTGDSQARNNGQNDSVYAPISGTWNETNLPDPVYSSQLNQEIRTKVFWGINADNGVAIRMRRNTNDAGLYTHIEMQNNGGVLGFLGIRGGNGNRFAFINPNGSTIFGVSGDGNARVFGNLQVDGSISETSDETLKRDKSEIPDSLLDAWPDVRQVMFRWKHAVEEKGEDDARRHFGWMAQDVERIMAQHGLSIDDYALVCKEPVYEEQETGDLEEVEEPEYEMVTDRHTEIEIINGQPIQVEKERDKEIELFDHIPVICENGDPVVDDNGDPILHPVPRMKKTNIPVVKQVVVDHRYTLRYTQCLVVEAAYLRREIERLKSSIS